MVPSTQVPVPAHIKVEQPVKNTAAIIRISFIVSKLYCQKKALSSRAFPIQIKDYSVASPMILTANSGRNTAAPATAVRTTSVLLLAAFLCSSMVTPPR